ncbi:MAG: hypothetical protein ACRDVP_12455, partial [Acidimicrobiales bacterium]
MTHAHLLTGTLVAVLSALLYNVGFVAEKHGLQSLPAIHARQVVNLVTTLISSPVWILGFTLMLVGLVLQLL